MKAIQSHLPQSRSGNMKTVLTPFLVGAALLLTLGDTQAMGYRGVGVGARGVGVAPGVGLGAPGPGVLPRGYYAGVPAGYRTVAYRGYTCRYVGGIYYRPVMYQGTTVYVVVQ